MEIRNKHVFITGSAKRLGRAIADSLLKEGARLSAHYHTSQKEIEAWQRSLDAATAPRFHSLCADLTDVSSLQGAAKAAEKHFGPVDILINSASAFYPKKALDTELTDWELMMNANARAQFFLAQALAPAMLNQKSGVILNIADVSGTIGAKGYLPYVCSKAALLMVTKNLAKEWAPHIRVNSVSPGPTLPPDTYDEKALDHAADRTLLKRWGTPDDIVNAVKFLIGNDYITGFDLKVDGGRSIA